MDGAALQLHTLDERPRAVSALTALLPPLALYAALALVLGALFGAFDGPALLLGAAVLVAGTLPRERAASFVCLMARISAVCAFALPAVRGGAMALANRLYAASEAVNAYAYDYFAAEGASTRPALFALAVLGGAFCALAARHRGKAASLLLGVAFLEAYFGVTPPAWRNLLLFAVLALLLARGASDARGGAVLLAGLAVVTLAVFLLAPRPNAAVEAYSERLRDELGALTTDAPQPETPPEEEDDRAHLESRQHEALASEGAPAEQSRREFERLTENEKEISLPRRVDYARIALLLLAAVALLVVPFAPFLLLNRARRRAAARRKAFEDADNAAAIRAMFAHTMDWLRAGGLRTDNRPYAQCAGAVEALTSADYAARYAHAAAIWQEAAYSAHAMSGEQRAAVRELLESTEKTLYGKADGRTRFRFKYIECLCE